jgi:outer membrane lipoprotein-sorting protein
MCYNIRLSAKERDMTKRVLLILGLVLFLLAGPGVNTEAQDAQAIVQASFDYWRGKASIAMVTMVIHRPDWERPMTLKAWTQGQSDSIVIVTAPPKDRGNGTLKRGKEMWMYNPKVNRVIKVPPSMMSQAWMGSDFSNDDLAKSDSILDDYTHTLIGTETHEGKRVYVIKSMPRPAAPVVWGMQRLKIREDHILLQEGFYDEDLKLVKAMTGSQIQMMGGRLFPKVWRMQKAGVEDEYTELIYQELEFTDDLPDNLFTLTNLRNPRQ